MAKFLLDLNSTVSFPKWGYKQDCWFILFCLEIGYILKLGNSIMFNVISYFAN